MKKDKDYWGPVYDEFISSYPELGENIVDWYPSGQMEITVKLRGGNKYVYDWLSKVALCIYTVDESYDESEDEWRERFSKNLCRKLRNVGMSQDMLAYDTGITPAMINRYIKGKATPSTYNLRKIADVLKCSINELIY